MSNVIDFTPPACPICRQQDGWHSPLCRIDGLPTGLTGYEVELFERYLAATGAKLVFPDGHSYSVRINPPPAA